MCVLYYLFKIVTQVCAVDERAMRRFDLGTDDLYVSSHIYLFIFPTRVHRCTLA